jgi:hypothetical protein
MSKGQKIMLLNIKMIRSRRNGSALRRPSVTYVKLSRSNKPAKKFKVKIGMPRSGVTKTIHFGARGMSDYTKHKDLARKQRYLARHHAKEQWGITGVLKAGFWARWLLWNKPSLLGSKRDITKRFNIHFTNK